jgi:P27 family predicted phage terminase small subunit
MGKRGPRRVPTHLRLLRGNPGHQTLPRDEPQPAIAQTLEPPPFLVGYAKEEWIEVAQELHRLKLLSRVDTKPLAAYCQAYAIWRMAVEAFTEISARDPQMHGLMIKAANGTPLQNPVLLTARQAAQDMVRFASEFGFTPAARSRISTSNSEVAESKFGNLILAG